MANHNHNTMVSLSLDAIEATAETEIVLGSDATMLTCFFVAWYSERKNTIYLNCADPKKLLPDDVQRIGFRKAKRKMR